MKFYYLPLVLLLTCTTGSWQASPFSRRPHKKFPRSTPHERDLSFSSGLPPEQGNSTETLCFFLPLPDIASQFGEDCSNAFAMLDDESLSPEMEEKALEDVCTTECMGRVIEFFRDDCKDDIVAGSLLSFCAKSPSGARCNNVTNSYDWTTFYSACPVGGSVLECSDKCTEAALAAVEAVGCCSNYDHSLFISAELCNLEMPQHCPDPFKVEEEEKEDEGDHKMKEGGDKAEDDDDSLGKERAGVVRDSSALNSRPLTALPLSLLLMYIVFS
jgi:hypothetical protein